MQYDELRQDFINFADFVSHIDEWHMFLYYINDFYIAHGTNNMVRVVHDNKMVQEISGDDIDVLPDDRNVDKFCIELEKIKLKNALDKME